MSASVGILKASDVIGAVAREATSKVAPQEVISPGPRFWKPGEFAREQIRGLVRQIFFSGPRSAKQVVFSAAEPHIDISPICDQVARALALETRLPVALMGRDRAQEETSDASCGELASIKSPFNQLASNLWYVERSHSGEGENQPGSVLHWLSCLAELRTEFGFAVIEGPVAGISSEAALLGHMTDGIILVLGAHRTRKATAQKIKQSLEGAQSRILGTVLSERRFPMPEGIYSRL